MKHRDDEVRIRPIHDQILIRQDEPKEQLKSGLFLPPGHRESWNDYGTVLLVGPGKNGVKPDVKPGDRVLFKRKPGSALEPDWREGYREEWKNLLMLREDDIIGVIEEE